MIQFTINVVPTFDTIELTILRAARDQRPLSHRYTTGAAAGRLMVDKYLDVLAFDDTTQEAIYALSSRGHGALALAESQAAERHRARVYQRDAQF